MPVIEGARRDRQRKVASDDGTLVGELVAEQRVGERCGGQPGVAAVAARREVVAGAAPAAAATSRTPAMAPTT